MQFVVTRHGSNAANQPMTPSAIIGTVEAANEAEAKIAAENRFNCYANQHLTLEDAAECSAEDCQTAWEANIAEAAAFTD